MLLAWLQLWFFWSPFWIRLEDEKVVSLEEWRQRR